MDEISYNILLEKVLEISSRNSLLFSRADIMESSMKYRKSPEEVLKNIFGYDKFRPLQKEIIQNVLDGRDTLAVMPTGGGKSLCYQIPALIMEGMTVVVSPLIALMQDQVAQLEALGIPAVYINSSLSWEEYVDTCTRVSSGKIKLLYLSPEGLNTQKIISLLSSEAVKIDCITIDEAHCISEWGHDFRPDYLEIKNLRSQFPQTVFLALTATATRSVQQDIVKQLKMQDPALIVSDFNRPNIFLNVQRKQKGINQIMEFLQEHKGQSGIIYCFSRKNTDMVYQELKELKFNVTNYHAGLSDEERFRHQNDFIHDKVQIIVATLAFGMGINKPDVRFVIHYDMPKSVEQYYQEIGRAGRDGMEAEALLLYSPGDINKIRFLFQDSEDPVKAEKLLQGMISYVETNQCRRKSLLQYFGQTYNGSPFSTIMQNCCDFCSNGPLALKDFTTEAQKFMSCILRVREGFGAAYIIDILLGSKSERISENGHDLISTYGIGRELKKNEWQELNDCLQREGYIGRTKEYRTLYLTHKGRQALSARENILLPLDFGRKTISTSVTTQKASHFISGDDKEGQRIVSDLRKWRTSMAEELKVPPYIIFGDKTMYDIAVRKPHTLSRLLECHGIGESKAEKFGNAILEIINR